MLFLFLFTFTWYVGTRERNDTLNVVNDAPSLLFVSQGIIKMTKGLFLFSVCRSDNGGSFSQNYFALPTFTFWSVLLKKAAFCRRLNMDAAWDNVAVTSLDFTVWDFRQRLKLNSERQHDRHLLPAPPAHRFSLFSHLIWSFFGHICFINYN